MAFIIAASAKGKISKKGRLEVNSLNQRYQQNQEIIAQKIMSKADFKKLHKAHQAEKKAEHPSIIYWINYFGTIRKKIYQNPEQALRQTNKKPLNPLMFWDTKKERQQDQGESTS